MMLGRSTLLAAMSAAVVTLMGCQDPAPTGPAGIWSFEILLETIEVIADCEGPPEDSPGEWTWRITLEVERQAAAEFGTADYPDFAGHVLWSDGETHSLGETIAVEDIPGSQVPSVVLTLEATEWDIGTDPPAPDGLMNGRVVRHQVPFAVGVVEDSVNLADGTGKCSLLLAYSVTWQEG